jgi:hypothetical protein
VFYNCNVRKGIKKLFCIKITIIYDTSAVDSKKNNKILFALVGLVGIGERLSWGIIRQRGVQKFVIL